MGKREYKPYAEGSAFDRPEYPESVQFSLDKYYLAYEIFIDACKDASRHDQNQLFDSMVGRAGIFQRRALAELASEGAPIVKTVAKELLSYGVNRGSMMQREQKVANFVAYLERRLIEAGFLIAKRKEILVPSNIPLD